MRAFALLLILANLGFWFWAHFVDVPESRPAVAPITGNAAPPRLRLANEGASEANAKALKHAAHELSCVSVGPFNDADQLLPIKQRLTQAGFTSNERSTEGDVFVGYWVTLNNFATKADADQTLLRLRNEGVSDAFVMNGEGNVGVAGDATNEALISLGLFADKHRAEQRQADIAKLGLTPQIRNRNKHGQVQWLDVSLQEPGQLLDPALLQPDAVGIVRLETVACPEATPPKVASGSDKKARSQQ